MTTAHDILQAASGHLKNRAKTYDKESQGGERSIGAVVEAFNAITGDGQMNTPERGWLFMAILKMVRSQQGEYRADNYEDGAAYFGLAGEAAAEGRVARASSGSDWKSRYIRPCPTKRVMVLYRDHTVAGPMKAGDLDWGISNRLSDIIAYKEVDA